MRAATNDERPAGIDATVYSWFVKRLSSADDHKQAYCRLAEALKGIRVEDLRLVAEEFQRRTGIEKLRVHHVWAMSNWLRQGYNLREIAHGMQRGMETAEKLNHTVSSPEYFTRHVHQVATGPVAGETRIGRSPR